MGAERLKEVALKQFALYGYEGASLAMIAEEVGIKKQSIYAHFKSKEDLFLQTFRVAVDREVEYMTEFIQQKESDTLSTILETFIYDYLKRYYENDNASFFMRTSFFPPLELESLIKVGTNEYVSNQENLFTQIFEKFQKDLKPGITPPSASLGFLTLLDGLFVEMLYGEQDRLTRRRNAAWEMLTKILIDKATSEEIVSI